MNLSELQRALQQLRFVSFSIRRKVQPSWLRARPKANNMIHARNRMVNF